MSNPDECPPSALLEAGGPWSHSGLTLDGTKHHAEAEEHGVIPTVLHKACWISLPSLNLNQHNHLCIRKLDFQSQDQIKYLFFPIKPSNLP